MNIYLHNNLKLLRKKAGISQTELAEKLAISRSQIASYETSTKPSIEVLMKLAHCFEVSIDALLKTDFENLTVLQWTELESNKTNYLNGSKLRVLATTVDSNNNDLIEVVSYKAKAGYTSAYADPEYMSELPRMQFPFLQTGRKYRVFQLDGDSMLPIPDKAYVTCEYVDNWLNIRDGEKYIVVSEREGIVFKLLYNRIKENNSVLCCSTNPIYPPFELKIDEVKEIWHYKLSIS